MNDSISSGVCMVPEKVRQSDKSVFLISPSVTYAPETRLSLGVYTLYYFKLGRKGSCTHPSRIQQLTAYTLRKQFITQPVWEIYFSYDNYIWSGDALYQKFPELFFGIGNNTTTEMGEMYSHQLVKFNSRFQKRFFRRFFLGPQYQFQYMFDIKARQGSDLLEKKITGYQGGVASGLGFAATWDSRDLTLNPSRGLYVDVSNLFFIPPFGSRYIFSTYTFEVRKYFPVYKRHVLALQGYLQHNTGSPPFRMMALMGSGSLMRGYYAGRFRDRNLLAGQAEYRFPVYKRFGLVVFGGAGQVAPYLNELGGGGVHFSYGTGLRYLYNKNEKINIRLDFGFGDNGSSGQYITVGEAF